MYWYVCACSCIREVYTVIRLVTLVARSFRALGVQTKRSSRWGAGGKVPLPRKVFKSLISKWRFGTLYVSISVSLCWCRSGGVSSVIVQTAVSVEQLHLRR